MPRPWPVIFLAVALVSCKLPFRGKRDAGVAPPPTATTPSLSPLTARWSDFDLKFAELSATAVGYFTVSGMAYELRFTGFPAGTTITMNGKTTSLSTTSWSERVDLTDKISILAPTDVMSWSYKFDPKIDFILDVPGYLPTPLAAPPRAISYAVKDFVAKSIDHPVLFKGEGPTDPPLPTHSILYTGMAPETYGPAVTMRDVDWIAVTERLAPKKGKTCSVKATGAKGVTSTTLDLIDMTVSIVERKTSKVVSKKTFPARSDCPTYAYSPTTQMTPDEMEMKRWVRDERSKP